MVADWANIPLLDVYDLPLLAYLRIRRDAFISRMMESEAGMEALRGAALMEQTKPDRAALRAAFG